MAKSSEKEFKPNGAEIAALAYQLFEQEGRPHGRDVEHWLQAEVLLKINAAQRRKEELPSSSKTESTTPQKFSLKQNPRPTLYSKN